MDIESEEHLSTLRGEFPVLSRASYFVSHSLGAMPRAAEAALREFTSLSVEKGEMAWEDWVPEIHRSAARLERLLNAPRGSVFSMASNVSHVQAIVASCLDYGKERRRVVYTALDFPSVSYVWKAEERRGAEVVIVPSDDGASVPIERLLAAIDERTLIVPVSHAFFRSSHLQDAAAIVARAHEVGALVLLDVYQSAGAVPIDVTALGVDMACGGMQKWLCGGPGSAYLYVRPDLISRLEPRVTGWFGSRSFPSCDDLDVSYADSIWRFGGGTPAVSVLYQARAGIELVNQIGVTAIRAKSLRQTDLLLARAQHRGYAIRSPLERSFRGGTVVLDLPKGEQLTRELNQRGFWCNYRGGAGIRLSPHFYTRDEEIDRVMDEIDRLMHG